MSFPYPVKRFCCGVADILKPVCPEIFEGLHSTGIPQFSQDLCSPDPHPVVGIPEAGDECTGCPAIPYPADCGYHRSPHYRIRIGERGYQCRNGLPLAKPPECLCTFLPDFPVRIGQGLYQGRDCSRIFRIFPVLPLLPRVF